MDLNLKSRLAVVTGSTGGIGFAAARELGFERRMESPARLRLLARGLGSPLVDRHRL